MKNSTLIIISREPLVHFLLIGFAIFGLTLLKETPLSEPLINTIVVDEKNLVRFLQYQASIAEADRATLALSTMPEQQRAQLIEAFVREEALFREGQTLGLDSNDRAIRQRVVQKTKFALEAFAIDSTAPSTKELQAYFASHRGKYVIATSITFSHIFFSHQTQSPVEARQRAEATLAELQTTPAHRAAPHYGDRFLYHRNYVEKTQDDIASHFGAAMANKLFALSAGSTGWYGPLRSEHGTHLVLVTQKTQGHSPVFAGVHGQVTADFAFQQRQQQLDRAIGKLVETYTINVQYSPLTNRVAASLQAQP